jgi:hypothetical protein
MLPLIQSVTSPEVRQLASVGKHLLSRELDVLARGYSGLKNRLRVFFRVLCE